MSFSNKPYVATIPYVIVKLILQRGHVLLIERDGLVVLADLGVLVLFCEVILDILEKLSVF